ncbi:MAG TPA: MFS transporter [Candidatus Methanomethylophilaceae archaeon]|nr:MFS transporter [Candidatus Methanomethylophilaceae archaeon]
MKRNSTKYAWLMFAVLLTAYFFVYFHRMSVAVVGTDIIDDVGGNLGFLSSAYFWTYAAMQIPCGIMVDRFGPRRVSVIFLIIAAIGSGLTSMADSFTIVIMGKVMIAAGMAAIYIPLMKVVSVWFPPNYFPQLNGITIAVGNLGAITATVPLQILVNALGWRDTFVALMILTFVIAILCLIFIKELPSRKLEKAEGVKSTGMLAGLKTVMSGGRKFWPMAAAYFFVYGSIIVFQGTYSKVYFDSIYSFGGFTIWLVAMIGIGKASSIVLSGILSGRGIIKSKRVAMLYGTTCYAAIWFVLWIFMGSFDNPLFWGIICSLFGFFGGFMSLSFSQVKENYPLNVSGTSVGALNVFVFLGASVATTISGYIIGSSYTVESFFPVWGLMFLFSVLAVVAIYFSKENLRTSQQQP